MPPEMNGATSLVQTAIDAGVSVCFANPGTTEMPLVAALDSTSGMRAVLGLFEGVCTGAADGYGRMTGAPALTLLHLGPGFANGIANLHNARRARSPVVNLIGDQASWHREHDAPLTSDIVSLATPVSGWVRSTESSDRAAGDVADAIASARSAPGQVATLILPADFQWGDASGPAKPVAPTPPAPVPEARIDAIAEKLRRGASAAILLGGAGLRGEGLQAAGTLAARCNGRLIGETFPARWERGATRPTVERLAYFPEQGREMLAEFEIVLLAGAVAPVAFFAYPDQESLLAPGRTELLAAPEEDVAGALCALAEAIGGDAAAPVPPSPSRGPTTGALNPAVIGQILADHLPEGAILVDEAATSGLPFYSFSASAPEHSVLALTGGAIGQGMPCATGAAVACPDRRVVSFQADGSAAYTLQALWTQAREGLDVITLLCSNRAYRILQVELARAGIAEPGPQARALTSLTGPDLDWVALARGFGVSASRVEAGEELEKALEASLREPGPSLIEMLL